MLPDSKAIAQFVAAEIRPRLAPDFLPYRKHDLIRLRGGFLQLLSFSRSRGDALRIHPTFFVLGADPSLSVIPQNVSLDALDPRDWSVTDPSMTADLGLRLVDQLERRSPLTFQALLPADPAREIAGLFHGFERKTGHWSPSLYLAHHLLARGDPDAEGALRRARDAFDKLGRKIAGPPPAWRITLGNRIAELERRLSIADAPSLCRTEAETQARAFALPPLVWP